MKSEIRVLDACQRLWKDRGIRDFTMDELAAEAGLSKRTVYKYYRSKEEIITAVVDRMIADMTAESERLLNEGQEPEAIFHQVLDYLFVTGQFFDQPALARRHDALLPAYLAKSQRFSHPAAGLHGYRGYWPGFQLHSARD